MGPQAVAGGLALAVPAPPAVPTPPAALASPVSGPMSSPAVTSAAAAASSLFTAFLPVPGPRTPSVSRSTWLKR